MFLLLAVALLFSCPQSAVGHEKRLSADNAVERGLAKAVGGLSTPASYKARADVCGLAPSHFAPVQGLELVIRQAVACIEARNFNDQQISLDVDCPGA